MLEKEAIFGKRAKALVLIALVIGSVPMVGMAFLATTPAAEAAPACEDLAVSRVTAIGNEGTNTPANTIDNSLRTRWSHLGEGSWITLDLGEQKVVCSVDVAWYKGDDREYSFEVEVSESGSSYDEVYEGKSDGRITSEERYSFEEIVARYVRITVDGSDENEWASVTEIDVNGYTPAADEEETEIAAIDNTDPSITITSPDDRATVTAGTVTVTGTSSDNAAGVRTVQVKLDTGSYTTATPRAPGDWSSWSINLSMGTGSHRILSRATDNAGNQEWYDVNVNAVTTAAPVADRTDPSIRITSPGDDATVAAGTIAITGTASDNTGVKTVQVKLDTGSYATAIPKAAGDWSTWSINVNIAGEGSHRILSRATDNAGNQEWYDVNVSVAAASAPKPAPGGDTTAPSLAITQPADGSTTDSGTISVKGTASDSGGVKLVEVRVDGDSYVQATSTGSGWSTWSASVSAAEGSHTLTARATDNAGNQVTKSINVIVDIPSSPPSGGGDGGALDKFGIEKIYPTKSGGNEWYVNMNDPKSDPLFKNLPPMTKQSDGSWQVSGGTNGKGQVRLEAWSPSNEKWLNVEITEYAKIVSGSNQLLQLYSRGGHHSSSNECLGSAYKARLYGDGEARWVKEVAHPSYTSNRGSVQVTDDPLEDRWVGFKAVIYNFVENGKTYVRMESYIDDEVTDNNGNLVIGNNWKLASVVEDRGGWSTGNSDFDTSCAPMNKDSSQQYRQRDEILNTSGGTSTQNIAAWRSDGITWNFKYLTVREIVPPT